MDLGPGGRWPLGPAESGACQGRAGTGVCHPMTTTPSESGILDNHSASSRIGSKDRLSWDADDGEIGRILARCGHDVIASYWVFCLHYSILYIERYRIDHRPQTTDILCGIPKRSTKNPPRLIPLLRGGSRTVILAESNCRIQGLVLGCWRQGSSSGAPRTNSPLRRWLPRHLGVPPSRSPAPGDMAARPRQSQAPARASSRR